MSIIKNPARSRPLSTNVKRLMRLARESPHNPQVEKIQRPFTGPGIQHGCGRHGRLCIRFGDTQVESGEAIVLAGHVDSRLQTGVVDGKTRNNFHFILY